MNEGDFVRLYQRGTANRRDAARVGCVPPEALLAVVEQQGSEEERLASINHAMTCADCGEELELLRATRVVRDRARIPHGGFALAASLVLVAGLGYYTLARRGSPEPAVDSAVMRRNRPVILRSFQRSVSPERIGADQRGSAMTRPRPVWRRRVSRHEFRILICFALLKSNVAKQIPDPGTRATTGSVVRWRRRSAAGIVEFTASGRCRQRSRGAVRTAVRTRRCPSRP